MFGRAILALSLATFGAMAPAATMAMPSAQEKATTGKVGEKLPAFAAKATKADKEVDFDSTKQKEVTVYLLVGVSCPATKPYAERLVALEQAYGPKKVDFVYLYPNVTEADDAKAKFHKECKFGGVFLNDKGGAVAKKLAAKKTGEALVVDKEGKVLYRGGIDDNLSEPGKVKVRFLASALDEVLAGKAVTRTTGDVFG